MTPYITKQGETVDLACWKFYGRTAKVTEAALAANPGLAALGPILPLGTRILMPDQPAPGREARPLIQLWA
jgi:phage tail protein X